MKRMLKMTINKQTVMPIEKIISILSYLTMGIVGLLWILLANLMKKNLKYFLMYNVSQSMLIAVFLALIKFLLDLIIPVLMVIPIINSIASLLLFIFSTDIIIIFFLKFSIFELLVFSLIMYIIFGVVLGRIFYVPVLTKLMKKAMSHYH